jgi:hypothetical protein
LHACRSTLEDPQNKKNPPKKSSWLTKLEEIQRENEKRMRARR